jgi:uncharacterized protein YjhX (UPF0386 family)
MVERVQPGEKAVGERIQIIRSDDGELFSIICYTADGRIIFDSLAPFPIKKGGKATLTWPPKDSDNG